MTFLKIIWESIAQAFQQLAANKLRTFLSLLGITIGIFCIIGVKSAVDSLETDIRGSFEKLGRNVVYISKFPWSGGSLEEFLKWRRRPNTSFDDFKVIEKRMKNADIACFMVMPEMRTLQYLNSNIESTTVSGATFAFDEIFDVEIEKGRYFSPTEYHYGANKCVIGATIATELFGNDEPIGKDIKMMGRKVEVIGVIKKSGEDLIGVGNFDEDVIVSIELMRKVSNLNTNANFQNSTLAVRAKDGISMEQFKDEITGIMRSHRRLKPSQESNFAVNELSMMTNIFEVIFSSLNNMAFIVGIFAILVGMFSVANIMFVSVKERTGLIGIKKALGAKKYIIMLEFLIESIILCILGGLFGLLLIQVVVKVLSSALGFQIYLSLSNVIGGLTWSVGIGIIAGLIPAFRAASMDPVTAMRS